MARHLWCGMLALAAGLLASVPVTAYADTANCAQFRKDLLEMERTSVRPPGWAMLDSVLRANYARNCVVEPTRKPQEEYWFAEDGSPLGVRADFSPPGWDAAKNGAYRPDNGAFITTPEIGAYCARQRAPFNPGMCAMIKGLEADCRRPPDSQARGAQCKEILAGNTPDLPPPSESLPPPFDLIGPAPATAPQMSDAAIHANPGFQKMCAQAKTNMDTCAIRQQNMASLPDGSGRGTTGQAGAFDQCKQLYGQVYAMCATTEQAA
ncbi:MAG: hypothetical protein JSR47_16910, partial [Proteobacteria bacterium]|nr:hypothetical protein [Pseudomonadota bacterium]